MIEVAKGNNPLYRYTANVDIVVVVPALGNNFTDKLLLIYGHLSHKIRLGAYHAHE